MVEVERIELPTSWSVAKCSIQLNYTSIKIGWYRGNRTLINRFTDCRPNHQTIYHISFLILVEMIGFEPITCSLSGSCSNHCATPLLRSKMVADRRFELLLMDYDSTVLALELISHLVVTARLELATPSLQGKCSNH